MQKMSEEKEMIILFTGILSLKELPNVSTPNLTSLSVKSAIQITAHFKFYFLFPLGYFVLSYF
jgi:hypothetical protein